MKIPGLGDIPFIGQILFNQTVLVYLTYLAVAVVTFVLFQTRWGLRVRSVGEHPKAADTVGIKVKRVRYSAVLWGGVLAGLLQIIQTPIPGELLLMAPYLATIIAVAGLVGRVRPPKADGEPYVAE